VAPGWPALEDDADADRLGDRVRPDSRETGVEVDEPYSGRFRLAAYLAHPWPPMQNCFRATLFGLGRRSNRGDMAGPN
jgi:hypothetical protein